MSKYRWTWFGLVFLAALFVYAIWPWLPIPGRAAAPRTITFYGFSILGEVMDQRVFPAFQEYWRARKGERMEFVSSFAGSGTITNQLVMGVPANIALLSLESEAERLAKAGITPEGSWKKLPYAGVVNRTPFVILVRPGNPKGIRGFDDLARPGIRVVHPDPLTSGGAKWAIVAEYGAGARDHRDNFDLNAGYTLLLGIWRNVVAQAPSTRSARTQFQNGFGDALITYEQEVLWDKMLGRLRGEIVYPNSTILSEHTLVVIPGKTRPSDRDLVDSFVAFLWTDRVQNVFAQSGFRSVNEAINKEFHFQAIADPFSIQDFGGWPQAEHTIIAAWRNRVMKEVGR